MLMKEYGLRIFKGGFVLHSDGRRRAWTDDGVEEIPKRVGPLNATRGGVKAFSDPSRKRLELIAASAENEFRSMLTLTYHAKSEAWEDAPELNARVVRRSKRDLNRFLSSMRRLLGAYLWIQEFQKRGVVHYHLLCEGEVPPSRVALAWCRATGELDDTDALRVATKVEPIRGEPAACHYVGRYVGKARQKLLPPGVEAAGRWWGRSRSVRLSVLAEVVVMHEGETVPNAVGSRVVRCMRRFFRGEMGFRFRGGQVVDWNGPLASRAAALVGPLRGFFSGTHDCGELARRAS